MAEPLRHRQTKEAATDMFSLQPPRHIPTLPWSCENASWKALDTCEFSRCGEMPSFSGMSCRPLRVAFTIKEGGYALIHRQKRSNTHNVHDPREIVGEYVQGHLGANFRQALH